MYLILLEKAGQEEAFSTLDWQPTQSLLREKLQEIADSQGYPVIARSHYPNSNIGVEGSIRVEHGHSSPTEPTALEKILRGDQKT